MYLEDMYFAAVGIPFKIQLAVSSNPRPLQIPDRFKSPRREYRPVLSREVKCVNPL
jgi:hypothetical protein